MTNGHDNAEFVPPDEVESGDVMGTTDYAAKRDEHLAEMEAWASGAKSIWNSAESREQAEMFDAACVARHAAAAMAYGFLASLDKAAQ